MSSTGFVSSVGNTAGNFVSGVGETTTGLVTGLGNTAGNLVSGVGETTTGLVSGLGDTAGNLVSGVGNTAGNLVSDTATIATSTAQGLLDIPKNLMDINFFDYLTSISGGPPDTHRFDSTLMLMFAAVFAGYTATALPNGFLKLFESPLYQFIVFYIIGITSYGHSLPPGASGLGPFKVLWAGPYVFLDAILVTCIFQLAVYLVRSHYFDDILDESDIYKDNLTPAELEELSYDSE
tara:strand:+ start:22 stop:729 length:708 start_codon:yes stop_codon:yes gene_type:complete